MFETTRDLESKQEVVKKGLGQQEIVLILGSNCRLR